MRRLPVVLAMVLMTAACGGAGGDPSPGAADGGLAGRMSLVPDTGETRAMIQLEDLAVIRSGAGVDLPADPDDPDQLADYALEVSLGPGSGQDRRPQLRGGLFMQAVGPAAIAELPAWRTEIGIGVADLDGTVLAGWPPDTLIVWTGVIDPAAVAAAVRSDPIWGADLRDLTHAGLDYWCWTDDPAAIDIERRTVLRPLGQGGCLAVFEGTAYRTLTREAMEAALEVRAGEAASLADHKALRLAASALDAEGPYVVHLTADPTAYAAADLPSGGPNGTVLERWEAMGVGAAFDPATLDEYLVLVLVYADEAAAGANATRLDEIVRSGRSAVQGGRAWAEIVTGGATVRAEGRAVVAILQGASISGAWVAIAAIPDTLTAWE